MKTQLTIHKSRQSELATQLEEEGLYKDGMEVEFNPDELATGIDVEMEHTTDRDVAEQIAKDHLVEDDKYYSKLKKIEKADGDAKFKQPGGTTGSDDSKAPSDSDGSSSAPVADDKPKPTEDDDDEDDEGSERDQDFEREEANQASRDGNEEAKVQKSSPKVVFVLEKAKKMPVGTISKGRKKQQDGSWVPVKKDRASAVTMDDVVDVLLYDSSPGLSVDKKKRVAISRLMGMGHGDVCSRCAGTGHHSFNQQTGSTCFKCNGAGKQLPKLTPDLLSKLKEERDSGKLQEYVEKVRAKNRLKKDATAIADNAMKAWEDTNVSKNYEWQSKDAMDNEVAMLNAQMADLYDEASQLSYRVKDLSYATTKKPNSKGLVKVPASTGIQGKSNYTSGYMTTAQVKETLATELPSIVARGQEIVAEITELGKLVPGVVQKHGGTFKLEKAKPYPNGTVRKHSGRTMIKKDGGWVPASAGEASQTEDKKESKSRKPVKAAGGTPKNTIQGSPEMFTALVKVGGGKAPYLDDLNGKARGIYNSMTKAGLIRWVHLAEEEYRPELTDAGRKALDTGQALTIKTKRDKKTKKAVKKPVEKKS